jgi:hypothetical protein
MKNNELSRMTVDIPTTLYKMLKTRAIREDKSLREVIIECLAEYAVNEYAECPYDHTPNAETLRTIKDAKKGIGIHHAKDAYELFEQCGIKVKKSKK